MHLDQTLDPNRSVTVSSAQLMMLNFIDTRFLRLLLCFASLLRPGAFLFWLKSNLLIHLALIYSLVNVSPVNHSIKYWHQNCTTIKASYYCGKEGMLDRKIPLLCLCHWTRQFWKIKILDIVKIFMFLSHANLHNSLKLKAVLNILLIPLKLLYSSRYMAIPKVEPTERKLRDPKRTTLMILLFVWVSTSWGVRT